VKHFLWRRLATRRQYRRLYRAKHFRLRLSTRRLRPYAIRPLRRYAILRQCRPLHRAIRRP
jgi:hypothetical protein